MEESRRLQCPHCGKRYRVQPGQIPAGTKALRCQACGQSIPVESSPQPSPKPASVPTVTLECSDCGKCYRVPKNRIPKDRVELPCKACGGIIPLPGAKPRFDEQPEWEPTQESDGLFGLSPSQTKSMWTAVRWGGLLLVLLIGLIVFYMMSPKPEGSAFPVVEVERTPKQARSTRDTQESSPRSRSDRRATQASSSSRTRALDIDPFWVGCIDVQALMTQLSEHGDPELMSDPNVAQALFMVQAMGVENLQWAVYRQGQQLGLAACLRAAQTRQLEAMLLASGPMDPNIQQVEPHHYRTPADMLEGVVFEDVDLVFAEDAVWLVSQALLKPCLDDPQALSGLPLMQEAQVCTGQGRCVVSALAPPENVRQWVTEALESSRQGGVEDMETLMVLGIIETMVEPCYEPLEMLESVALGLGLSPQQAADPNVIISASMSLTLRDQPMARQVVNIMERDEPEPSDWPWVLVLKHYLGNQNSLQMQRQGRSIQMSWVMEPEPMDPGQLQALAMEQMMAPGLTEGMMGPEAWDQEEAFAQDDVTSQEARVFFQGVQRGMGFEGIEKDNESMALQLSLAAFPSLPYGEMSRLVYTVSDVETADGSVVVPKQVFGELQGRDLTRPWSMEVPLQRDCDPSQIRAVKMDLVLSCPMEVERVTLNAEEGAMAKQGAIKAGVAACKAGHVTLQYRGGRDPALRLYDGEGQVIHPTLLSEDSYTRQIEASYQGELDRIELLFARQLAQEKFTLVVPIEVALETRPTRIDSESFPEVLNFDIAQVASTPLEVTSKQFKIPASAEWPVRVSCEVYPLGLQTTGLRHPKRVSDSDEITYDLPPAQAWYGALVLDGAKFRDRLEVEDPGQRQRVILKRPGNQEYSIRFEGQDVTVVAENGEVVRMAAYNQDGQRLLLADDHTERAFEISSRGRKDTTTLTCQFYGTPVRIVLDVQSQARTQEKVVVDACFDGVDAEEYAAFKKRIDKVPRVIDAMAQAATLRQFIDYGDDIAGLHCLRAELNTPRVSRPRASVSRAVAMADPAATGRFGYQLRDFYGYHLTVLPEEQPLALEETRERRDDDQRAKDAPTLSWNGNKVDAVSCQAKPWVVAIPQTEGLPMLATKDGQEVYRSDSEIAEQFMPSDPLQGDWMLMGFKSLERNSLSELLGL